MKKELLINGNKTEYSIVNQSNDSVTLSINGKELVVEKAGDNLKLGDKNYPSQVYRDKKTGESHIQVGPMRFIVEKFGRGGSANVGTGDYLSPMPGKVFKVLVSEGDEVKTGDPLLVMEAMKMEHTIKASSDGIVSKIFFAQGEQVDAKKQLIEVTT